LSHEGQYQAAKDAFIQALKQNPEDSHALYSGAMACHRLGEALKAGAWLEQLLQIDPQWRARVAQNPLLREYLRPFA
jgi:tetratricopeptide (TPR) repeat protein